MGRSCRNGSSRGRSWPCERARAACTLVACTVMALVAPRPAGAQPGPPSMITAMGLEEALQESVRTRKFLIVFPRFKGDAWDRVDEETLKNPTLATWVMWHAILVRLDFREKPAALARFMG